nr:linker for activation of T-cells family member 2 isoform X1 [Taeniopygia guttata]
MLGLVIHRGRKPATATSPGGTSPGSWRCWSSWDTSGTAAEAVGWIWPGHGAAGAVGGRGADAARGGRQPLPQVPALGLESQQRFEVIRSHTAATRRLEKSKEPEKLSIASKANEELSASHHTGYGSRDQARYQNFLAENCLEEDTAYVEPMSLDHYYNCTRLFKPPCGRSPGKPEKDEDSHSYENVTIGVSQGSDPDEAVDYENSMTVLTWKLQQGQAPVTESLDDEPDYINTDPAVRAKAQELQSALEQLEPALLHAVGTQSPCSEQGFPQLSPACCARTTHPAPLSPPDRCC